MLCGSPNHDLNLWNNATYLGTQFCFAQVAASSDTQYSCLGFACSD